MLVAMGLCSKCCKLEILSFDILYFFKNSIFRKSKSLERQGTLPDPNVLEMGLEGMMREIGKDVTEVKDDRAK